MTSTIEHWRGNVDARLDGIDKRSERFEERLDTVAADVSDMKLTTTLTAQVVARIEDKIDSGNTIPPPSKSSNQSIPLKAWIAIGLGGGAGMVLAAKFGLDLLAVLFGGS